ncbi:MAG TPA: SgcJ/EcaC family oxidoreductase [Gemmatimonadaceae bacterium]|nr:SgcJ/EcaC family oxidoreductase [Gemmatimonadaceae bacterium]
MRLFFALPVLTFAIQLSAQTSSDSTAVRNIIKNEIDSWNKGDAVGYSRDFSAAGTFTNIRGQFFTGYPGYLKQHEVIFQGIFKNSAAKQEIVSLKFVRPDVAIIETVTTVSGAAQGPVGVTRDDKGRIRTRLLQVVAKEGGVWKIVAYHNVDVKPEIPFPEPK